MYSLDTHLVPFIYNYLFHAVKYNDVATVKRLLSRFNYNINFFDKRYKTLLHYAVQYNFVSICKILLEYIDIFGYRVTSRCYKE
ncbi:ankyrin repeat protein [Magpiepox virus]|nr:ankyrin repeat protein [Magpiepox virus]